MPKYYVESGWVRMITDARSAEHAAVKAFQRCREREAEIYAEPPSDVIRDAEAVEWQLSDEIRVNEIGFGGTEGQTFDTFEIAAVWQDYTFAGHGRQSSVEPRYWTACSRLWGGCLVERNSCRLTSKSTKKSTAADTCGV